MLSPSFIVCRSTRSSSVISSLGALALALAGCGGVKSPTPPGGPPVEQVVGTSGGQVASSDGQLAVAIPAGAVGGDVTISVAAAEAPAAGAVSTVYEIGP